MSRDQSLYVEASTDVIGCQKVSICIKRYHWSVRVGAELKNTCTENMEGQRYAIVQWEDEFTSILSLESIKTPRKAIEEYFEGEFITANYGKKPYRARISEISDDRQSLAQKKKDGTFPLKFTFSKDHDQEKSDSSMQGIDTVKRTDEGDGPSLAASKKDGQFPISDDDQGTSDSSLIPVTDSRKRTNECDRPCLAPLKRTRMIPLSNDLEKSLSSIPATDSGKRTNEDAELGPETVTKTNMISDEDTETFVNRTPTRDSSCSSSRRKLEKRIIVLEKEVGALKKTFATLKKSTEMEPSTSEKSQGGAAEKPSEAATSESLLALTKHFSDENDISACSRTMTFSLFSREDLVKCSRTGKKTVNSPGDARPALNPTKLTLIETAMRTKFPTMTKEAFNKKMDNLFKVERRLQKNKQSS